MNWDFSKPAPKLGKMTLNDGQSLVDGLWEEVRHLKEQARLNSRNSSKPPSSDYGKSQKKKKPNSNQSGKKRQQGGQPGHEGRARKLLPVDQVDEVVKCVPSDHCDCGGRIWISGSTKPRRHQVFEMPDIRPHVTEYHLFSGNSRPARDIMREASPQVFPMVFWDHV